MPDITVTLIEGYGEARRGDLAERLTDAAVSAIGAPVDRTTVVINEVPAANYLRGRTNRTPGTPPAAPTLPFGALRPGTRFTYFPPNHTRESDHGHELF